MHQQSKIISGIKCFSPSKRTTSTPPPTFDIALPHRYVLTIKNPTWSFDICLLTAIKTPSSISLWTPHLGKWIWKPRYVFLWCSWEEKCPILCTGLQSLIPATSPKQCTNHTPFSLFFNLSINFHIFLGVITLSPESLILPEINLFMLSWCACLCMNVHCSQPPQLRQILGGASSCSDKVVTTSSQSQEVAKLIEKSFTVEIMMQNRNSKMYYSSHQPTLISFNVCPRVLGAFLLWSASLFHFLFSHHSPPISLCEAFVVEPVSPIHPKVSYSSRQTKHFSLPFG